MAGGPIEYGDSELARILRSAFGPRKQADHGLRVHRSRGAGLEDVEVNLLGKSPGLMYAEGKQTQKGGMRGREAQLFSEDLNPPDCPSWMLSDDCRDSVSRLLEQTFRNFQLAARRPSHIDPPFSARPINPSDTITIAAAGTAAGPWTSIVCYTVSATRFRGEIPSVGHIVTNALDWLDIEWRITVDGTPLSPWNSIIGQHWDWLHPTILGTPIHLISGQTICVQARALVNGPYEVSARMWGWEYPVRVETGREIRSTIVD